MIQQQSKICLGAMKLIQWPAIARGVTGVLWPGRFKSPISTLPFSCSSTMAQAHKKESPENSTKQSNPETQSEGENSKTVSESKGAVPPTSTGLKGSKREDLRSGTELEAVMKVKSLSSAIEICSTFDAQQSIDALKNLVAVGSRPLTLIQALAEGITKSSENMNMKEISDLLFLLAKLSYINEGVLSKTCEALKSQLKNNSNAAVVGSSIVSIRTLQWKDPDLLDECSVWIQKNIDKFENPSNFIYTLALQNHIPHNMDELVNLVWRDVAKNKCPPRDLVTLVWSLYALNSSASMNIAKEVLQRFFTKAFLSKITTRPADIPVWIKLWNLSAIAKSVWGTAEFKVPEEVKTSISNTMTKNAKKSLISDVTQLLFKDLDANLYKTNVPSQMGFPIDLVLSLDDKMNVIPLHLATSESSKIAVMIHSYRECCQPTKEPNGAKSFAMRLLGDQFRVISVPYHILGSGYVKVHEYFDAALKEAVKKNN